MDALIENVNTTAMVIGYPILAVILLLTGWFGTRIFRDITKLFNEMRYDRWKRKYDERTQTNAQSSWVLELDEYYDETEVALQHQNYDTDQFPVISPELIRDFETDVFARVPAQRHDTAELPQLFNYQEERQ